MNPEEEQVQVHVKVTKSDREQLIDLAVSLVTIGIVYYRVNPEPFDKVLDRIRRWYEHRVSIFNARQAIRSLPETQA